MKLSERSQQPSGNSLNQQTTNKVFYRNLDEHDHGMQCDVRKLDSYCHKTIKLRMRARLIKPDHYIK